jgi:DNA-binding response OmpR family regulator
MTNAPRVLLAEDDRLLRRATEATLKKRGFDVILAVDGEEALQKARQENPHLVLLDVIMPKLQGFEVLVRLKADPATAGIPVIMLSNLGQESDAQEAFGAGAAAYLIKSQVRLDQLAESINTVLGRSVS